VDLVAELKNGKKIRSQKVIHYASLTKDLKRIYLDPKAKANPKALSAIREANLIIIGPGDLYSSLVPNLLVSGLPEAIRNSRAIKAYICNLMTKQEHTDGFTVSDYVEKMEQYIGGQFNYVVWNDKRPSSLALKRYAHEGEHVVELEKKLPGRRYVGADLISRKFGNAAESDPLAGQRTLIRHDSDKLARLIFGIVWQASA
jgi:uncharacterized cofD-like protein